MKTNIDVRVRRSIAAVALGFASLGICFPLTAVQSDDVLRIDAPVQLDPARHDGGLPLVRGVENIAVFRASRAQPDFADGKGYTYNHHPDLAAWRGRLYVAWDSGEKDEDTWPARELYSTSTDGRTWSAPSELFPQGTSTPLRLYFFHAPNDRMLAFAGLRLNHTKTDEAKKGSLVVREIHADHTLGPVFTLRASHGGPRADDQKLFTGSADAVFVAACRALLASRVTLETQDYGLLLEPAARSPWHDAGHWADGKLGNGFWKAPSFFHRADGALVGIGKNGWASLSTDEGVTWSQPVVPPTLITNNAKVWGQRTSDGRYALIYNPTPRPRFPLALITGDDGITFRDMRTIQEDFPPQRYLGLNKNFGLQYVRGISEWASDGSWRDRALWLVYSANKEDIWVSRVPVGAAARSASWSLYQPKWSFVSLTDDEQTLVLESHEPLDAPTGTRFFSAAKRFRVSFTVGHLALTTGTLDVDLGTDRGGSHPIQIGIGGDAMLHVADKSVAVRDGTRVRLDVDAARGHFALEVDARPQGEFEFAATAPLARATFRLKARPALSFTGDVPSELDRAAASASVTISQIEIVPQP